MRIGVWLILVMAASMTGATAALAAGDERSCTLTEMSGRPGEVLVAGSWQQLQERQVVDRDARLRTGDATRIHIVCDDGIRITVGVSTEILLGGLVGPAGTDRTIGVKLLSGIAGFVAPERSWGVFKVTTDVAIASVRSTEWLVETSADKGTAVFTRKGVVEVRAGGATFSLGAGEGVTINASGAADPVKVWGAARIAQANAALGYDWQ